MSEKRYSKSTERIASMCMLSVCVLGGCLVSAMLWALLRLVVPSAIAIVFAFLPGLYFTMWTWRILKVVLKDPFASNEDWETELDVAMFGQEKLERMKRVRNELREHQPHDSSNK